VSLLDTPAVSGMPDIHWENPEKIGNLEDVRENSWKCVGVVACVM